MIERAVIVAQERLDRTAASAAVSPSVGARRQIDADASGRDDAGGGGAHAHSSNA